MGFIGKTQLFCTQLKGFGPHLAASGESLGIYRVAALAWGIFWSYGRDVYLKLEFDQRSQDTCQGTTDTSGI